MGKEEFVSQVETLRNFDKNLSNLEEVLGIPGGLTDSSISKILSEYGNLILGSVFSFKKDIPDEVYEDFWNDVIFGHEDIESFYERIVE